MPKGHLLRSNLVKLIAVLVALCSPMQLPAYRANEIPDSIHEPSIEFALKLERGSISVEAKIPANGISETVFATSRWAGVNDFHEDTTLLEAVSDSNERLDIETVEPGKWKVTNSGRPFTLRYNVKCNKNSFFGNNPRTDQFRATLMDDWVWAWGYSYILDIEQTELSLLPVIATVSNGPFENVRYSWEDRERIGGCKHLQDSLLVAGDFRFHEIPQGPRNLRVAIHGDNWAFSDDELFEAINKIANAQSRFMGIPPKEDFLLAFTAGNSHSSGGTVVDGAIGIYPNPAIPLNADNADTLQLISHEYFHLWNARIIHPDKNSKEGYYKWFHEGITEYYSLLTLLRTKLVSEKQFVARLNGKIRELAANPANVSATAAEMSDKYFADQNFNKLPYTRGCLIGFLMDVSIRKQTEGSKTLDDFMRELFASSQNRDHGYTTESIGIALQNVTGQDWSTFLQELTVDCAQLPIQTTLAENLIEFSIVETKLFQLGFEVVGGNLELNSRISRVATGSSAEEAGLEPGDIVKGMSIHHGDVSKQAKLRVQRGIETLDVEFIPSTSKSLIQLDESDSNLSYFSKF